MRIYAEYASFATRSPSSWSEADREDRSPPLIVPGCQDCLVPCGREKVSALRKDWSATYKPRAELWMPLAGGLIDLLTPIHSP